MSSIPAKVKPNFTFQVTGLLLPPSDGGGDDGGDEGGDDDGGGDGVIGGSCGLGVGAGGSIGKIEGGGIFLPPFPPSDLTATSINIS